MTSLAYKDAILKTDEERKLFEQCKEIGALIAAKHNLKLHEVQAIETPHAWGMCSFDGIIKLTFYKWLDGNERWVIEPSEVLRTLAHELAHLRHYNHGPSFFEFSNQLIKEISELTGIKMKREQNCYRR